MPRVRLSKTKLDKLRSKKRRYDLWDSEAPGLIVQVTPHGHRSFMLCKRMPGQTNSTRRLIAEVGTIELAEAREIAREWSAMIRRGIDPGSERQKVQAAKREAKLLAVPTVAEVCEDYIKRHISGLRRAHHASREVRQLADRWEKLPLPDLTRAEVIKYIEEATARSQTMAHRQFGHLRAMFNWLRERGMVESSPCDRIRPNRLIGTMQPRQRTLTDKEVRALWIATGKISYPHGPLHRLVLLTGLRLREVAEAHWKEFDLKERLWHIPAERTKSHAIHIVPLSTEVMTLLLSLPNNRRTGYVFRAPGQIKPVKNFHTPKTRIDAEMAKVLGRKPDPWVVHDLRRVVRSNLAAMGVREEIAERVLGHGPKNKLVRTYNTYNYLPEVREALEEWEKAVGKMGNARQN